MNKYLCAVLVMEVPYWYGLATGNYTGPDHFIHATLVFTTGWLIADLWAWLWDRQYEKKERERKLTAQIEADRRAIWRMEELKRKAAQN